MRINEVFDAKESRILLIEHWWDIECILATENECFWSSLIDFQDQEERRCGICEALFETNEYGNINKKCPDSTCSRIRDFWTISGIQKHNLRYHTGSRPNRRSYLSLRMESYFGTNKLWQVPQHLIFEFLLSAMLERMAHEKEHTRS